MKEIWKDISGYEGFYQVSNYGRVKNLPRTDNMKRFHKERILLLKTERNGYERVHVSKNGTGAYFSVHRLVAEAFITKPDGCNIVNHLDNNKTNNAADNLEWTTLKGNMQHASKQGRMRYKPQNLQKAIESRKRSVIGTNGIDVVKFESAAKAEAYGFDHRHIADCCNKRYGYRTHKGYSWRYENE